MTETVLDVSDCTVYNMCNYSMYNIDDITCLIAEECDWTAHLIWVDAAYGLLWVYVEWII